ncbi:multidrug resistance-associated protein 1-like [Ostrea edulis]|uniref:multidrug resistance-associated protein 1-like n=1 Tax=Ostrea edulis TaxID=37623 RepID=UPI0024AFFCF8|nr:multidrug resistance-associated protein 1-like [Ostrea edulis]
MEVSTRYPKPRTVVLMGHSFIRRLGAFMNNVQHYDNLRLQKDSFEVLIRAKGGLKTYELANSRELLDFQSIHTDNGICYIQIGGNDFADPQATPRDVARQIMALAHFLLRFSYQDLWAAIERAHMKDFVTSCVGQLNYECGEGGQNLSVGQRQQKCFARALLHKKKIPILDEATAAVDVETDNLIQWTIKTEFRDCTVMSIAHRLNTIKGYDRIMVMDEGRIAEFDTPDKLLQNKSGLIYSMVKDANIIS